MNEEVEYFRQLTSNQYLLSSWCEGIDESIAVHVLPDDSVIKPLLYVTWRSGYGIGDGIAPIWHIYYVQLE